MITKRSRLYGSTTTLALFLMVIASGCGGGNDAVPSANAPITREEATNFAQEVNLRHADVPYLTEGEIPVPHRHPQQEERFARCAGTANPAHHSVGPLFNSHRFGARLPSKHAFVLIVSGVSVWTRPAFADAQYASDTPRGRACRERQILRFTPRARGVSATAHVLSISLLNIGATEVRVRADSPFMKVPVYFDLINFLCGPAEVELLVETSPQPGKPWLEEQLLSILYNRARKSELIARTVGSGQECPNGYHAFKDPRLERRLTTQLETMRALQAMEAE